MCGPVGEIRPGRLYLGQGVPDRVRQFLCHGSKSRPSGSKPVQVGINGEHQKSVQGGMTIASFFSIRSCVFHAAAVLLACLFVVSGPNSALALDGDQGQDSVSGGDPGKKPYRAEVRGEMASSVREVLESVSDTFALRDRPPATTEMLRRRARADILAMQRGLRSEGYYDGRVVVVVDQEARSNLVVFEVETGPAYVLKDILFDGPAMGGDFPPLDAGVVGLEIGSRARAPAIEDGAGKLRDMLREHGHPFPRTGIREAVVDHESRTMVVRYFFEPGPEAQFGPVAIEGLDRVHPDYVLNKIPWLEGQRYRASLMDRLRARLLQDGLFTLVNVSISDEAQAGVLGQEDGLPVTVAVVERVPRTVKAGASYETDTGLGTALEWEHRNIFGEGERLRARADLAEKKQMLTMEYRIPAFLDEAQSLEFTSELGRTESDTYTSKLFVVGATVYRQLAETWTASLGAKYRLSDTTQYGDSRTYALVSAPGELTWDKRNDVLNPTRGWWTLFRAEPFVDTLDPNIRFLKLSGGLNLYLPLTDDDRLVLAGRGALGSILGENNRDLPPDERFYGGGGGSIRGYAYQSIGPEKNGKVVGGRSMVETGLEARYRLPNNFGLVAFLDGGQVFSTSTLKLKDDFLWGTGLGLRYFTDFAPLRLDVAVPLNRRDKDKAFQFYVSIGQAF
ncbi:MAG: outer membrane protein assembly factor [Deltaproteobacteria bacterium]|nr:outer membrane protein assembly factor [Deltaproteobacteria bacterium]